MPRPVCVTVRPEHYCVLPLCAHLCMVGNLPNIGLVPLRRYPQPQGSHVRDEPAATSLEDAGVKACRSSGSAESLINA